MPTSGTSSFNYNRDQIIKAALRKIGAIASGETPDTQTIQDSSDQLNIMVKAWNATGLHIWTEEEATLFLQPRQITYTLGGSTTDNAASSFVQTTLSAGGSAGTTSISVVSVAGVANGNFIGITLASGPVFWTTVNGTPSGNTINLASGLSGAANGNSLVFVYSAQIIRPLRVVAGRRYNYASQIDTPMIPISRLEYRDLPNKTTPGTITQFFYDPRGGTFNQGLIYVWPAPPDATDALKFTWYRPIQDFNTSANMPDLPNEWIDALIWNLAAKMAPEYDCPPQRYMMLKDQATNSLDLAMGWDREPESIYFGVNFDQR